MHSRPDVGVGSTEGTVAVRGRTAVAAGGSSRGWPGTRPRPTERRTSSPGDKKNQDN